MLKEKEGISKFHFYKIMAMYRLRMTKKWKNKAHTLHKQEDTRNQCPHF